jgi:excisionase family DNA binding protein
LELLSITDAASRIGVSRRTVYRWIADGTLTTVGTGRGGRIAAEDLDGVTPPTRHRTPATSGDVRQHILTSAASILAEHGHAALTIEQVATAAGMSVGGVTYHFATKAALIDGLVDAFLDQFEHEWSASRAAGATAADAYITVSQAGPRQQRTRAILLAALDHPSTMRRIDRRMKHWYQQIAKDSPHPDADLRRCLAADAVWLYGLLGLRPLGHAEARRITQGEN